MPLGYELVADSGALTSAVTQYDFTGLNFTSDDVLMLVSDIINPNASNTNYYLYANSLTSIYYNQKSSADSTTVSGTRATSAIMAYCEASDDTLCNAMIKLTESGYFTWQASSTREYGQSGVSLDNYYGTKSATISSMTSLSVVSSVASGIGIGSRFKLYKIIAEPLADIIVTSDTTQVDITDLNLDETNELLLVSDTLTSSATTALFLSINDYTTLSDYYRQRLDANGSSVSAGRGNFPDYMVVSASGPCLSVSKIKLTNSGYFVVNTDETVLLGTSSIYIKKVVNSSTFTVEGMTKLSIIADTAGAISGGSRFKLYKLK